MRQAIETPDLIQGRKDDEQLRRLLALTLAEDDNCVDVGANVGKVLDWIVRAAPTGVHHAFEPVPLLYEDFRDRYPQVVVSRAALSDREGVADFTVVTTRPSRSGFRKVPYPGPQVTQRVTVPVTSLDAALPAEMPVTLIKIDVEGAEMEVLAGAANTIRRWHPVVVFEHQKSTAVEYGTAPADVWTALSSAGLRIFDFEGTGPYDRGRFADAFEEGRIFNFLAHR